MGFRVLGIDLMALTIDEPLAWHGHLSLIVRDAAGHEVDRRDGDNVMCTTGFTAIAAALAWSGIQDQATAIGTTTPTYLTPLWGAVGTGTGVPAKADIALYTELARQTVGAGAYSPATSVIAGQTTWLFFFPPPAVTWTISEAGVFALGTSVASSGSLLDHQVFSPVVTVTSANSLILQASFGLGP